MTAKQGRIGKIRKVYEKLGLSHNPFTESPTEESIKNIFTGREKELDQVFGLFAGQERRRILVYGRIGIGKSAFLFEVLSTLRSELPEMLTAYASLPVEDDLAKTAFIALADKMPKDEWAQQQLHQLAYPTTMDLKEHNSEINAGLAKTGEKDIPITKLENYTTGFNFLLDRALKKYPDGVLIAIDDLDKQNPSRVRQLMHDAQGMLKGKAWFILTGHPLGITQDLLTSERGLFDLKLKLEEMDQDTTYEMLIKYLNSARINNNCTDPKNPLSVSPFTMETAKKFCEVSLGKPRFFNRLGLAVLSAATSSNSEVNLITSEVLRQGFKSIEKDREQFFAEKVIEKRIYQLLKQLGSLSDDDITMEALESIGFKTFNEILPYLENLEEHDFAQRLPQTDAIAYEPILLPSVDE
jgi:hypothetical protein